MKRFFKWGCISVIGLFVLVAILVAIAPDSAQTSPTPTSGQSLAIIAPTATTASVAPAQAEQPTPELAALLQPTETPIPTETPAPTPVPTPMPEPIVMTGFGGKITADFRTDAPLIIVEYSNTGTGYFGIQLKDAESAELVELLENTVGAVTGTNLANTEPSAYYYEVEADGDWSITTKLAGHWTKQAQATSYSFAGRGNSVSPIFTLADGRANISFTHNGEGYFGVFLYDVASGQLEDLLANMIGPANESASVAASARDYIFKVSADGDWTIQVSQ